MPSTLVITDVTRMGGDHVCIAGYLPDGACVRPETRGKPLLERWLQRPDGSTLRPFAEIEVELPPDDPYCKAPHIEDRYIRPSYRVLRLLPESERLAWLERTESPSVEGVFEAPIRSEGTRARWLDPGTGKRSLGTIEAAHVRWVAIQPHGYEASKWSYRLGFEDKAGQDFTLGITDLSFRAIVDSAIGRGVGRPDDIAFDIARKLKRADVWLRIGLARPFAKSDGSEKRCYLQVNGIYSFPDYLDGRCFADAIPVHPPATLDMTDLPF